MTGGAESVETPSDWVVPDHTRPEGSTPRASSDVTTAWDRSANYFSSLENS